VYTVLSAFLALLASSVSAAQGVLPKIQDLTGPPHGTWGEEIVLRYDIASSADAPAANAELLLVLRRRDGNGNGTEVLLDRAGVGRSGLCTSVRLPKPPDRHGNADGDFDIDLRYLASDGRGAVTIASHPIHIETRDRWGRIDGRYVPRNYDLIAANSAPARTSPDWLVQTGIRHAREDCSWGEFESEDGKWSEKAFGPESRFGSLLLQHRKYDMTALPVILAIPPWAQARGPDGKPMGDGGPPADPERFAAFVDKVVGYYSKAPYSQQDWQIWNEASGTTNTGFWSGGSWENYVNTIHNPAARAIRKHYVDLNGNGKEDPGERCRVVYGGFPCSNWNDGSYVNVLDINGCGDLTDILDGHYMQGLRWFEREWSGKVYQKWMATGKTQGCWLTEEGYDMAVQPLWTPLTYFQDLGWALNRNWNHKDKYRNYFFHYYAAQEKQGFYWSGPEPRWPNGHSIRTLMKVTRGDLSFPGAGRTIETENGTLTYSSSHQSYPPILCGGRLVMIFRPDREDADGVARVSVRLKPSEEVKAVRRTTLVKGIESPLEFRVAGGLLRFDVPWKKVALTEREIDDPLSPHCYITVECARPIESCD
jgi:hypothetical protein